MAIPKLRDDLLRSQQESGGHQVLIVKDPVSGKFFRFEEAEQFILERLDGTRDLEAIRAAANDELDAELDLETLQGFVKTLDKLGLLTTSKLPTPAAERKPRRDIFYLRFKAIDPGPLLDRMIGRLRWMFTPWFVTLSAAVIVFAVATTVMSWNEIIDELSHLNLPLTLLTAWITILAVGAMHEFAHGLTCTNFGGRSRDMGFYLLYLHPALYCNVSDAWMFPKSRRLWVSAAGSYFEMFIWALATFVWRVMDAGTLPNNLALVIMATSGVKTLFNFNPLMKLDGYYVLSDLLEIPNLRRKSFGLMGAYIRQFFTGKAPEVDHPPRERRILVLYGVLALVYMTWFLWLVAVRLGGTLVPQYQFLGFMLVGGAILLKIQSRLSRFLPGAAKRWRPTAEDDDDTVGSSSKPSSSRSSSGSSSSSSKSKSKAKTEPSPAAAGATAGKSRHTGGLIGFFRDPRRSLAAGAALVLVMFGGCVELKVTGDISVLPIHNADVHAEVDGLVSDILVTEGQTVKQGAILARISDREIASDLSKIQAELREKRARLKMLEVGARPQEVQMARSDVARLRNAEELAVTRYEEERQRHAEEVVKAQSRVKTSEERLRFARTNLERLRALRDAEVLSQRELEKAEEEAAIRESDHAEAVAEFNIVVADNLSGPQRSLAEAQRELAQAQGRLELMEAGTRPEEVEATRAEVARLVAEERYLEEQLRMTEVRSPIAGVVTTPARVLGEMRGRFVKRGDLIAEVYELETIMAEIVVPEKEIADVHVGQKVLVKARAYPNRIFEGRVTSIATTAHAPIGNNSSISSSHTSSSSGKARQILVTTQLGNDDMLLKPDMTGKAKILCGKRRLGDLFLRSLSRTFRVEFWSWW